MSEFGKKRNLSCTGSLAIAALLLGAMISDSLASDLSTAVGLTEPVLDVTLSASVPGIITARRFKEGDFVKEGEAIVELDKRLEELELERRKLVLEARRFDYERTA